MVKIVIENLGKKEVSVNHSDWPALKVFQYHRIDWMHACGGKGRCTTCKMTIINGMENISALTDSELRYRNLGALSFQERLACQAKIQGDITIRVPDETKLPHIAYWDV